MSFPLLLSLTNKGEFSLPTSFYALDWFYPDEVPPPTALLGAKILGSLLSSSTSRFPSSSSSIYCYLFGVSLEDGATYFMLIGGSFNSSAFFRSRLELTSSSTYLIWMLWATKYWRLLFGDLFRVISTTLLIVHDYYLFIIISNYIESSLLFNYYLKLCISIKWTLFLIILRFIHQILPLKTLCLIQWSYSSPLEPQFNITTLQLDGISPWQIRM